MRRCLDRFSFLGTESWEFQYISVVFLVRVDENLLAHSRAVVVARLLNFRPKSSMSFGCQITGMAAGPRDRPTYALTAVSLPENKYYAHKPVFEA